MQLGKEKTVDPHNSNYIFDSSRLETTPRYNKYEESMLEVKSATSFIQRPNLLSIVFECTWKVWGSFQMEVWGMFGAHFWEMFGAMLGSRFDGW